MSASIAPGSTASDASPKAGAPVPMLDALPGLPRDDGGPVFREPWEAQAFAMALQLHEQGLFTWSEWASTLAGQIRAAQAAGDPDSGERYYHHWLAALEELIATKGASSVSELERYRRGFERAARRTPHGTAIELSPPDLQE